MNIALLVNIRKAGRYSGTLFRESIIGYFARLDERGSERFRAWGAKPYIEIENRRARAWHPSSPSPILPKWFPIQQLTDSLFAPPNFYLWKCRARGAKSLDWQLEVHTNAPKRIVNNRGSATFVSR